MSIKTVVMDYEPKSKKMAKQIENVANEMEQQGYEFITFSITPGAKAILAFRDAAPEGPACADENEI